MSSFCTSCGNAMRGSAFCTSCGAVQNVVSSDSSAVSAVDTSVVLQTSDQQLPPEESSYGLQLSEDSEPKGKKKVLVIAAIVLLFTGGSTGGFFVGKSSIDVEKEKMTSYESGEAAGYSRGETAGYSRGETAGYSRGESAGYSSGETAGYSSGESAGYSRGYDEGKVAGCESVFSFRDGIFDYVEPYDPYNRYDRHPGGYYTSKSDC